MYFKVKGKTYRWDPFEFFINLSTLFIVAGAIASLYFAFWVCGG